MDSILDTETHNSNLSKGSEMFHFIHKKQALRFYGEVKFSNLADHMTINHVIGMSHGEQEPMESRVLRGKVYGTPTP